MPSRKQRKREVARRRYERRQERLVHARNKRRRRTQIAAIIMAVVALMVLGGYGIFRWIDSGNNDNNTLTTQPTSTPTPSATPAVPGQCAYTKSGTAAGGKPVALPPTRHVDHTGTYLATVATNQGTVTFRMPASAAPCTVNSFRSLAAQHYFDNTPCHRLTTTGIYVLQCGDPTGTGTGGPGYQFADENLSGATYPAGTVAMANSGPGTNGSQFFLVYKDTTLPPNYTPFGHIVTGLSVIKAIAAKGSTPAGDGKPKEKVTIETFRVTRLGS